MKSQEQVVFNKDNSGEKSMAFVLRPVRYSTMNGDDIVNYCAANSIVPKAYLAATMVAVAQCIENFLLNGHSVAFPNLGTFSLSTIGYSVTDAGEAGISQLEKLRVRFLPCSKLKTEVENVSLEFAGAYNIAGENSDGVKFYSKIVKKTTVVTPEEDDGNPDDETPVTPPAGGGSDSGTGGSDSGGSGDSDGSMD